ncbi:MAG: 50S ribosome-binding GTPase [Planctomycetes bacterium]|nr:50S ribosome-binding GTPase [Planctomycetota bacterium]
MQENARTALEVIAHSGDRLRTAWHFDWPTSAQQAVHCLRYRMAGAPALPLVAIVGGASSGKSTVFNNLLDGRRASRITARGHCTLGPILFAHERNRTLVEKLLDDDVLMPGLHRNFVDLDSDAVGAKDALHIGFHHVDALADVLLFDTPDFTSEAARREGDVLLGQLAWFDRLIIVVDHERWYDRQSIGKLRSESVGLGQERMVLFNRTQEGALGPDAAAALEQQAKRLDCSGMSILEFRRGRGLCRFAPGTLDDVVEYANRPPPDRSLRLLSVVADAANQVLNQNEERVARLSTLRSSLFAAVDRALPSAMACMTALMTQAERRNLDVVSRTLRLQETKDWLVAQRRRIEGALRRVPIVGTLVVGAGDHFSTGSASSTDRDSAGLAFYESAVTRQSHEVNRTVGSSEFWDEITRWTGIEPADDACPMTAHERRRATEAIRAFGDALDRWNAKVERECEGVSPHAIGALGAGAVGLCVILIAVQGPLSVLTLTSAKAAIGAALGKLATVTGAGAVLGKPIARLAEVVHEKLIGSAEFLAVKSAAGGLRDCIHTAGRQRAEAALERAAKFVMPEENAIVTALGELREPPEAAC